jgi:hypothetical protein
VSLRAARRTFKATRPREVNDVLDGDGVGQQVVVPQPLLLLVRLNLKQQAVVCLNLVGAGRDLLTELGAAQVFEQKSGSNDAAEFGEGLV